MFNKKGVLELVKTLGFALIIALIFRSTIAAPYKIPTGSMIPTLLIGDHIFVSKLTYGIKIPFTNVNAITYDTPKKGEVVVFQYPLDKKKDFIKRVIGTPGDVIEIRDKTLFVNNKEVFHYSILPNQTEDSGKYTEMDKLLFRETINKAEHLIQFKNYDFIRDFGPYQVPENHIFVMGDNRDTSSDSRVWGPVHLKYVRGKAKVIWLSLDKRQNLLKIWRKIRFDRFLRPIE